ncbi:unnamed protein product [Durusdinium trenchii]|uniref:Uncharacterized protein n=1 Tax=Durusdinium trenchii TaxID=1381693 RepID=A0ABP0RNH5_9DINO
MSRSLLRLPVIRSSKAGLGMGSRYRLAPRQDDLRFVEKRPGAWDSSVVEDEDDDLTDSTASEAEVQSSRDSWTWAPEPGPGQYEEFYGPIGANKWKAKWWNPSAGLPQQNHRRATIQAEIAELVASGQPKEEIYRAIREAYNVTNEEE